MKNNRSISLIDARDDEHVHPFLICRAKMVRRVIALQTKALHAGPAPRPPDRRMPDGPKPSGRIRTLQDELAKSSRIDTSSTVARVYPSLTHLNPNLGLPSTTNRFLTAKKL